MIWSFSKDDINPRDDNFYIFAARKVNSIDTNVPPGILIFKIEKERMKEVFSTAGFSNAVQYMIFDNGGSLIYKLNNIVNEEEVRKYIMNNIYVTAGI